MLKLTSISEVSQRTRFDLTSRKSKVIEPKPGKYKLALITSYRIPDRNVYSRTIHTLLKNRFFIIFVSTEIPLKPIINDNIIYVATSPRFMGTNTFESSIDYIKFNFVVGLGVDGKMEAKRISDKYRIPFLTKFDVLPTKKETVVVEKENIRILFDTNYEASGRGLGDILMSTAIIKQIRKNNPKANITYSTRPEAHDVLLHNTDLNAVISTSYNRTEFEKILDNYDEHYFLGKMTEDYTDKRNQQPRIDSMAELFNLTLASKKPELFLTEDEKRIGKKHMKDNKINIVFCMEGIEKYRRWRLDYLNELLNKFNETKYNLIVVGTKPIEVPAHVINLTTVTNMRELFGIIYNANLVVSTDNFVSHIAAAFDIQSVILYTTIPAEWRCKYYKNAIPIQSPVKCSPCNNLYSVSADKEHRGCSNNGYCIDKLTPKLIYDKIKNIKINKKINVEDMFDKTDYSKIKTHSLEELNDSNIIFISLWRRLGDCLFGIPTIKAIRKKYPKHKIIWGTHYKYYDIVKNLPYIDGYVLFQGKVDEGWDAYLPSADGQIQEYLKVLKPGRIFNLHISPRYSEDLTKQDYTIVEYVAYKLAGFEKIDTVLEYFPNRKIESKVRKDFENFKKGYKGIITYNGRCFSIAGRGVYKESELDYTLSLFERAGYKVINVGNIVEDIDISRDNYHFCSLDYIYYAIKYSDLFIGYDSGIRNLALTVKNSKILSLENEHSLLIKTKIEMLSKNKNHVGITVEVDKPLDIFLKGMSLINNEEIVVQEYRDILKFQFVRRKEALVKARQIQEEERGILNG